MLKATFGTWLNYATTLGFQILLARTLGAGPESAAFQSAYYLGVSLSALFISTGQAVLVPRLVLPHGSLDRAMVRSLGWITATAAFAYVLVATFAEPLAPIVAGDGVVTPDLLRLSALFALAQVLTGGLRAVGIARGHRFLPALAPAGPTLVGSIALLTWPTMSVTDLYLLVTAGSFAQLLLVVPGVWGIRLGNAQEHQRIKRITVATLLHFVVLASVSPIEISVASHMSPADASHYIYATRSLSVAQALLIGGLIMSALGDWSRLYARADPSAFRATTTQGLRLVVLLIGASAAVAVVFGEELVALLYERGAFQAEDTRAVRLLLLVALGGFAFESISMVTTQILFAARRNDLALRTGLTRVAVRLVLIFTLAPVWGVTGIAVAYTLSAFVGLSTNVAWLRRLKVMDRSAARRLAATAAVVLVVVGVSTATITAAPDAPVAVRAALLLILLPVPLRMTLRAYKATSKLVQP